MKLARKIITLLETLPIVDQQTFNSEISAITNRLVEMGNLGTQVLVEKDGRDYIVTLREKSGEERVVVLNSLKQALVLDGATVDLTELKPRMNPDGSVVLNYLDWMPNDVFENLFLIRG